MSDLMTLTLPLQGDFYNEGDCMACGAPQHEAPGLIEHTADGRCCFKRQPQTEEELDQSLGALAVSCIGALRYGGREERILKRLHENGMEALCDHQPKGSYGIRVHDTVLFEFDGTLNQLADSLIAKVKSLAIYDRIENYQTDEINRFSFTYIWCEGVIGAVYEGEAKPDNRYRVKISREGEYAESVNGLSWLLHDKLKDQNQFRNLQWFEKDKPDGVPRDKPY